MRSTQILTEQHTAILTMLERLEELLEEAVQEGELDAERFDRLLEFFELRVDGEHQEEEERIFLPRLLTRASGQDVQHVHAIHDEHIVQRQLLVQMRCQLQSAARGEPEALFALAELGRRYVRRQRLHAAWEDAVLVPLAERVLTPQDDRAILNGFRRLEETWGGDLVEEAKRTSYWLQHRCEAILA